MPRRRLSFFSIITSSRKRIVLLTIVMVVLLVAICGALIADHITSFLPDQPKQPYQAVPSLATGRPLRVGVVPNYRPLRFEESGQLEGFEVDLARALAIEIGLPVELVSVDESKIDPADSSVTTLSSLDLDLFISGVVPSQSWQRLFRSSDSYVSIGQVAVAKVGQALLNEADLQHHTIAVIRDSVAAEYARLHAPASQIVLVTDASAVKKQIEQGRADVGLIDLPTAHQWLEDSKSLQVASPVLIEEKYSMISDRNQAELHGVINQALSRLKQKGVLVGLEKKWLGY